MHDKEGIIRPLFRTTVSLLMVFILAACQNFGRNSEEISSTGLQETQTEPGQPELPSKTPFEEASNTPTVVIEPSSTATEVVFEEPTPSSEVDTAPTEEIRFALTLDLCKFKFEHIDDQYPNPQENLDPATGTTWMAITLLGGILNPEDSYHYWWDTRAFSGDLSFNKANGPCEVLVETNQILCQGLPLKGTDNLPTGGYEYNFLIYIQDYGCNKGPNYEQRGLIFMETMEHDVFVINGEDAHQK